MARETERDEMLGKDVYGVEIVDGKVVMHFAKVQKVTDKYIYLDREIAKGYRKHYAHGSDRLNWTKEEALGALLRDCHHLHMTARISADMRSRELDDALRAVSEYMKPFKRAGGDSRAEVQDV